ncbi:pilus assembly protein [Yangia mangrovi]|uniref:Pilus assembly protein n=1 Tax=Alloyangia mangrovi TaxID=1779329 RepID=A0A2A3JV19_9RHOB|nr:TadE family protein [Alloyangia mangrovi]MCA0942374.1 pilus assembly protein [Alloyangia pacifica]MCA0947838.1 pilus assembly protein [Alloyangia pacifica]MCT4369902.1 pilus assembly protein [Alloyangia mangrovi]
MTTRTIGIARTGTISRLPSKKLFAKDFVGDEEGSLTVEVAIWAPAMIFMLALILDFAFMMVLNASMWNAARETARAVSLHRVLPDQADDYLRDRLLFRNAPYRIAVETSRDEVDARVTLAGPEASLTPVMGRYLVGDLNVSVAMLREPN